MKNQSSNFLPFASILISGLCCALPGVGQQSQSDSAVIRCVTDEVDKLKSERSESYRLGRINAERLIDNYISENRSALRISADELIQIPVVVHVIHNQTDNKIGGANNTNISDEQVFSQIAVLNEDYRRKEDTNGFNANPVGADTRIEFVLARYDPDGRSSKGITRHYSTNSRFSPYTDDGILADIASWPTDKYLNIWVCPMNTGFLGVAQLPSVLNVDGLDNSKKDQDRTDGVIIDYRFFGSVQHMSAAGSVTSKTYDLGRTTTHEVGHWLGLLHTWGNVDNNCGTDYCADTPQAKEGNLTFVCDPRFVQCAGENTQVMIENYMDYSPDRCMNIFTKNQLERMRAVIALSPRRAELVKSSKEGRLEPADNLTLELFPNPSVSELFANVRFRDFQSFTLSIYDQRGILMRVTSFENVWSRKVNIDTEGLLSGLYICKVTAGGESVSKRFVIN
jgi:hypothetical protein